MNFESRIIAHRHDVSRVSREYSRAWAQHIGMPPESVVSAIRSTERPLSGAALAAELPEPALNALVRLGGFLLFGFEQSNSYRFRLPDAVRKYETDFPRLAQILLDAGSRMPLSGRAHDDVRGVDSLLNPRELKTAVILAADEHSGEDALLWLPSPTAEYAIAGSWSGCRRFKSFETAFEDLLGQTVEALRGALSD